MKISVYLKKCSATTSNICFRVREKNVDIKVVSPIAVHDKYWDTDTLCYRRTTAVTAIEQKRVPEQIAAIIERAEKTFSEKADGKWMKQVIEDVLHPARASSVITRTFSTASTSTWKNMTARKGPRSTSSASSER